MDNADPAEPFDRAVSALAGATTVSLACHVNPDGDALGSTLGLHHAFLAAGRPSVASFPEPFVVAPHYRLLPGLELLSPPGDFPAEPETMVTFDCGSIDRLGELAGPAKAAHELVVVDHHVSNDRFGTINLVEPTAAASAVLVYRLIARLGLPLTREAATCLYAGIVCDTGRFTYECTTPEVFAIAGHLSQFGLPIAALSRSLFEEHRFAYLRLVGEVLGRAELHRSKAFVWAAVSQEDLARFGVTFEELEGLIDILRRTREAEVTCILKEGADASWRVSLRSVGETDVAAVAHANGGGGHRFAAGFTSWASAADTVARIAAAL
jgi:bifunctional oligoribonuclease and PAP phosphatase NrnA